MARIAYVEGFSGAAGDMLLGALIAAGAKIEDLAADLARLSIGDPIHLRAEPVTRGGLSALKLHVDTEEFHDHPDHHEGHDAEGHHEHHDGHHHGAQRGHGEHRAHHEHPRRGLSEIRAIISESSLSDRVKERAIAVFTRLGEAEAEVHGVPVERIHFHEVGALDAIADIVGTVCAIERLGIETLYFSTLRVGGGMVRMAHGTLPAPAPATVRLLKGFRAAPGPVEAELVTPTGAALLTTLGVQRDPPPFTIAAVGCGAGSREFEGLPNVVRVFLGDTASSGEFDTVWQLECNLDDATPQVIAHALDRLLAAGALDAWAAPIVMKKSRPATLLAALVEESALARVEEVFFRETPTFGVRRHAVTRAKLDRSWVEAATPWGAVRVKVGRRAGVEVTRMPEFEDCRRIADERGVAFRDVWLAALQAAR